MKKKVRLFFLSILSVISPKLNYQYRYKKNFGRKLNLKNPKTFNEKIIWLELNNYIHNELAIQCSDKFKVRDYIRACGCEEILIPQFAVWENVKEIQWSYLPDKFVLKWNFGAGFNHICSDKSNEDPKLVLQKMSNWGKIKYWLWYGEKHYKYIPKRIIGENFISDLSTGTGTLKSPEDYKFYCFNGKVKYILLCLNRKGMIADYVFFNTLWEPQPFSQYAISNKGNIQIERPKLLDKAISYAERLAVPFPFVRVDLYILKDKIFFGELTFTPCGGVDKDLYSGDFIMGKLLKI